MMHRLNYFTASRPPGVASRLTAIKLALLVSAAGLTACSSLQGPAPLQIGAAAPPAATATDANRAPAENGKTAGGFLPSNQANSEIHFDWPVDEARMTRGFLSQSVPSGRRKKARAHWGLDLANHKGTPIMAAERGTVIYTGHGFRGYGKLIVVEHNDEWATLYSHLDQILVKEGQPIAKGEKIGLMGRTGHATGVHLHFEVRRFRQPVNPLAYLPQGSEHAMQTAQKTPEHWVQLSQQAGSSGVHAEPQSSTP